MSPQEIESQVEQLFPWYASTQGPGLSSTLLNLAGTLLPVLNLLLAKYGIAILPDWANMAITLGVFGYFGIKAAIGYVKAKKVLGARIASLQATLQRTAASGGSSTAPSAGFSPR